MKEGVTNAVLIVAMVLTLWAIFRAFIMIMPVLWPVMACLVLWLVIALVMSRMK